MKQLLKKDGYALIWVLGLFMIVMILTAALFSVVFVATTTTTVQVNAQQAYFSARSTANAAAAYIKNLSDTDLNNLISDGTSNIGSGSNSKLGSYTVKVTRENVYRLRVQVNSVFNGESSQAVVFLKKDPPAAATVIPTDKVFYVDGNASTGFGQTRSFGDMYINGDFTISDGSSIDGTLIVNGNVSITGAATNFSNALYCKGNVTLGNSGAVKGDVKALGGINMSGAARITGNAYANGSLVMTNGYINGNAVIGQNATFSGGAQVLGSLTYYGTGNPTGYVSGTITKPTIAYVPFNLDAYKGQTLNVISPGTISSSSPTMINKVISSSGTLTSNFFNGLSYGSVVTIDTSTSDINLLLNNTSFNTGNGLCFEVTGPHNLCIYLKGSSNFTLASNQYFGMKVRGTNPQIFIIGDTTTTQTVTLSNNSELDACIYMPFGKFIASGSVLSYDVNTYKFVGSCTVKSLVISSNVPVHYSPSTIDGSPLDVILTGGVQNGAIGWQIEKWVKP